MIFPPVIAWSADYQVTNLNDNGAGSFRAAIAAASNGDTITFSPALSGTITLLSPLPDLNSVTLVNAGNTILSLPTAGLNRYPLNIAGGASVAGFLPGGILASSASDEAHGLDSTGDMTLNNVSGSVFATTGGDVAIGVTSFTMTLNDIAGSVKATATGDAAFGLAAVTSLTMNDISGSVAAAAGGDSAYGLGATAVALNDISGSVTAAAGRDDAVGVLSFGDLTLHNITGAITAHAGRDGSQALESGNDLTLNDISGALTVTAERDFASGLLSGNDMTLHDISGTITVTAGGENAVGLGSRNAITLNNLSGAITVTSGGDFADGLGSNAPMTINQLSGSVTVISGGNFATGLNSFDALTANNISGSVSARASGQAIAIAADQGLNINVTGTLTATDSSGAGSAYAIAAGDTSAGPLVVGGAVNDTVVLGDGANITGKIELGGGTNLLTLNGAGNLNGSVNNITTLTKTGIGRWTTRGKISTHDLNVNAGTLSLDHTSSHTVANNLTLASGAILRLGIRQTLTQSVSIANTLTNNGRIDFILKTLVPSGTSFTPLASNTLVGTGTYTAPLLTLSVAGNNVVATKKSYTDIHIDNPNAQALAAMLDPFTATATGDLATILTMLDSATSVQEFGDCMKQLSTLPYSEMSAISIDTAQLFSSAIQTYMAQVRSAYTPMADKGDPSNWPRLASIGSLAGIMGRRPDEQPNSLHLRLLRQTGSTDAHDGEVGYDYTTNALSGGVDRMLSDGFLAGISFGYGRSNLDYLDQGRSSADIQSHSLGLYGTWFDKEWYVDTAMAGALNRYDINRRIPFLNRTANADYSGYTVSAKAAGGYNFPVAGFGLTPMLSMEYTRFHQEGYTETGAGAANLSMEAQDANSFQTGLGAKIDRSWQNGAYRIIPELSALWMHEFAGRSQTINLSLAGTPGFSYPYETIKSEPDSLRLGIGVTLISEPGIAVVVRYQTELEKYADHQRVTCNFQMLF